MLDHFELPYQTRVGQEKVELDKKLDDLVKFKLTKTYAELDPMERERLNVQTFLMTAYSGILGERIANFGRSK